MLETLAARSEPLDLDDDDDEETAAAGDREPGERWRLLVLEFAPLAAGEANAWLAEHGLQRRIDTPKTIAELHALLRGAGATGSRAGPGVGFG